MVSSIAAIDINNMWVRILVLIPVSLKALDTFDICQRPVFSLGVSIGRQRCERIMQEKTPCRTSCVLSSAWIRDLSWGLLKNYNTSDGAVTHNVLFPLNLFMLTVILSNYPLKALWNDLMKREKPKLSYNLQLDTSWILILKPSQ